MNELLCYECGKPITETTAVCPFCSAPQDCDEDLERVPDLGTVVSQDDRHEFVKRPSNALFLLLFILGSSLALSIGIVFILVFLTSDNETRHTVQKPPVQSAAGIGELQRRVGDDSKFTDEKKEDIFRKEYKGKTYTWSGKVSSVQVNKGRVHLDVDDDPTSPFDSSGHMGVELINKSILYDLEESQYLTIRFVMRHMACLFGCSYYGDQGVIVGRGRHQRPEKAETRANVESLQDVQRCLPGTWIHSEMYGRDVEAVFNKNGTFTLSWLDQGKFEEIGRGRWSARKGFFADTQEAYFGPQMNVTSSGRGRTLCGEACRGTMRRCWDLSVHYGGGNSVWLFSRKARSSTD